jgi:hypothetical protein
MQKVREEVILEIFMRKSLNLELWLERYDGLKFEGYLWIFLGLGTSLELFFKNQGSTCETSRPWVDYPKVQGPFYKISEFNQNNELFLYRKSRGLGPWVVDHGRVTRSTMD